MDLLEHNIPSFPPPANSKPSRDTTETATTKGSLKVSEARWRMSMDLLEPNIVSS
jgi:hypothetical protein